MTLFPSGRTISLRALPKDATDGVPEKQRFLWRPLISRVAFLHITNEAVVAAGDCNPEATLIPTACSTTR